MEYVETCVLNGIDDFLMDLGTDQYFDVIGHNFLDTIDLDVMEQTIIDDVMAEISVTEHNTMTEPVNISRCKSEPAIVETHIPRTRSEPVLKDVIEAFDAEGLLEQFEEASQSMDDKDTNDVKKEAPVFTLQTPVTELGIKQKCGNTEKMELSKEMIQKLKAVNKPKSAVMLPLAVPAKRGRGRAMARGHPVTLSASCTPRRLHRVMMQNSELKESFALAEVEVSTECSKSDTVDDDKVVSDSAVGEMVALNGSEIRKKASDENNHFEHVFDHDYIKNSFKTDPPGSVGGSINMYKNVIMIVKLAVDMLLQLIAQTMCLKGQGQDLIQELVVQGHFLGQGHYKGQERRGSPRILHVLDTLAQVHRVQRRLAQTLRVAGQVQAVAPDPQSLDQGLVIVHGGEKGSCERSDQEGALDQEVEKDQDLAGGGLEQQGQVYIRTQGQDQEVIEDIEAVSWHNSGSKYARSRPPDKKERRIVYVGGLPNKYSRHTLRDHFTRFGPIENVQLHFREHGDNYGFVTFTYTCDAFAAIEKGKKIPGLSQFDLCFGGRRQFCDVEYADLDGNKEIEEEFDSKPPKRGAMDFDELLRQAKAGIKKV
ncbi:uncharacterized protein LOC132723783 [Ruditapes philippinarum]|uniref:uncharacterized protein LOC132723783 n=1 Tax=Ruditapes philippinarum TaxID=129788 RepID=UPI00295B2B86|nr:uncharacterized protein LOC132723783 [Ruditapes philippinarum]